MIPGYRISANKTDMDLNKIHSFISKTYWAANIPFDVLKTAIENSLCFGVFTDEGEQIGFAKVVENKTHKYHIFSPLHFMYWDRSFFLQAEKTRNSTLCEC